MQEVMTIKIVNAIELEDAIKRIRALSPDSRVVQCHGVFDLVHPGHLEHFEEARKLGEVLVVSITADEFINKGPNRPYFDEVRRARFLAALEMISYVYIVQSESAVEAIKLIKPDFYVKGPDYRELNDDITGKIELEKKTVEKFGGKLVFTDGFTSSSTSLINKALISQDSETRRWVNEFKKQFNVSEVLNWIDKLSSVDVGILGEAIIDVYTNCRPLAKSSKDPILAFQRFETQSFMGGTLAIADSCSKWSRNTSVYSVTGKNFREQHSKLTKETNFKSHFIEIEGRPTIIKHRFVDINSGNRVFEYYDYQPDVLDRSTQFEIFELLDLKSKPNSLLLLADYGHGFFGQDLIRNLCSSDAFLCVNTQSNAGNRGFNTFSKYPRIDLLSLNGGELELELRKRDLNYRAVVPQIMREKNCKYAVVTLGGGGLLTFDASGECASTPALASKVVDKVGAGDSVLAISSMLAFLEAPKEIIGLLSSVVAAFEVSQLGHQESMSVVRMKKYINGILG